MLSEGNQLEAHLAITGETLLGTRKILKLAKARTVMSRIASHCIILSNLTAQASPPGSSILNVPRSNTADILDPVHPVLGITRLGHREDCTP